MSFVTLDVYEPDDLERMLSMFLQVGRENLEKRDLCDLFWFAFDGHPITMERKTWRDLINSIEKGGHRAVDSRLESRLRKASRIPDIELGLMLEGIAVPLAGGEIAIFEPAKNEKYLYRKHISGMKFDAIYAILWQLRQEWNIVTYFSPSMFGTAWMVKTFVENSQKAGYAILQHYVRTHPVKWQSNPAVETIMGIKDEDGYVVGEKKAIALVENIGSVYDILQKSPEEIATLCRGLGISTAERLIEALFNKGQ